GSRLPVIKCFVMAFHLPVELSDPFRLERARVPKAHVAVGHIELSDRLTFDLVKTKNRAAVWTQDAHVAGNMFYPLAVIISDLRNPSLDYVGVAFGTGNSVHVLVRDKDEMRTGKNSRRFETAFIIARLYLKGLL